jgi:hypothetical protein
VALIRAIRNANKILDGKSERNMQLVLETPSVWLLWWGLLWALSKIS